MTLLHAYAIGLLLLWVALVALGLRGRRRAAAIMGGFVAVAAGGPFAPRLAAYLIDRDGFITQYGAAAVGEVAASAVLVALGVGALATTPLTARRRWGWLGPAALTALPVALVVWLAFWFSIF